ncbi:MAG: hypothetical protein ABIR57_03590 [Aeromicrobium sp.]
MSLASRRNPRVVVPAILSAMFLLVTVLAGQIDEPRHRASFLNPVRHLTVLSGKDPASLALDASRQFYGRAPVVVIAADKDKPAQALGAGAATRLQAPLLMPGPGLSTELKRLRAEQVLVIGDAGATRIAVDRVEVPADSVTVDNAVATIVDGDVFEPVPVPESDTLVITRSTGADLVPLTNARNAGATVVELPGGDPRRDPRAAKILKARPDSPVVALGMDAPKFAYTLLAVRKASQQPGGGYFVFPGRTMVAFYGYPGSAALGALGEQGLKASIKRAKGKARAYKKLSRRPVIPTFEIIATVASSGAGKDKDYSSEAPLSLLRPWVEKATKSGMYVVLDLQPGRSDFLRQAKRYESLLAMPHVGLALDPEWRLTKHQKPLRQIGSVNVAEINRTAAWLAALTRKHALPQKLLILHQFQTRMIRDRGKLNNSHPELSILIHVDGQGTQPEKQSTWKTIHQGAPKGIFWGWKNFYDEDDPTLSVKKTWSKVKPRPEFISYQ